MLDVGSCPRHCVTKKRSYENSESGIGHSPGEMFGSEEDKQLSVVTKKIKDNY